MIILCDQDDTLADYQGRILEIISAEYPELPTLAFDTLEHFYIERHYPLHLQDAVAQISQRKDFFRNLKPIPGGKEALEFLRASGHDVFICTAPLLRYTHCVREKYEWIEEHFGDDWTDRMILTRDKTLVHGDKLIDDKPVITGVGIPKWEHIFYDRPYNRREPNRRLTWTNFKEVLGV